MRINELIGHLKLRRLHLVYLSGAVALSLPLFLATSASAQTDDIGTFDPPESIQFSDVLGFTCASLRPDVSGSCPDRAFAVANSDETGIGVLLVISEFMDGKIYYYYPDLVPWSLVSVITTNDADELTLFSSWPGFGRGHWSCEVTLA